MMTYVPGACGPFDPHAASAEVAVGPVGRLGLIVSLGRILCSCLHRRRIRSLVEDAQGTSRLLGLS